MADISNELFGSWVCLLGDWHALVGVVPISVVSACSFVRSFMVATGGELQVRYRLLTLSRFPIGRFKFENLITSPVCDRISPGLISSVSILTSAGGTGLCALQLDIGDVSNDTAGLLISGGSSSSSVSSQATLFPSAPLIDRSSFFIHSLCSWRKVLLGGNVRASEAKVCSSFSETDSLQSLSQ